MIKGAHRKFILCHLSLTVIFGAIGILVFLNGDAAGIYPTRSLLTSIFGAALLAAVRIGWFWIYYMPKIVAIEIEGRLHFLFWFSVQIYICAAVACSLLDCGAFVAVIYIMDTMRDISRPMMGIMGAVAWIGSYWLQVRLLILLAALKQQDD